MYFSQHIRISVTWITSDDFLLLVLRLFGLFAVSQSDSVLLMVELCSSEQSNYFSTSDTMTDIQLVHFQDGAPHISVYEHTHTLISKNILFIPITIF